MAKASIVMSLPDKPPLDNPIAVAIVPGPAKRGIANGETATFIGSSLCSSRFLLVGECIPLIIL